MRKRYLPLQKRKILQYRKCFERYVDARCSVAGLYAADEEWLLKQKKKFEKEAEKILANRVLSGVKAICRLEKEKRGEAYLKSHREYLASRMIMEALDMLLEVAELKYGRQYAQSLKKKMRGGKPSDRRAGKRKDRNKRVGTRVPELGYYLIVTDTEETEKNYFEGLRDSIPVEMKDRLVIKVEKSKTVELVERVVELTDAESQYRIPWIVFDRD